MQERLREWLGVSDPVEEAARLELRVLLWVVVTDGLQEGLPLAECEKEAVWE